MRRKILAGAVIVLLAGCTNGAPEAVYAAGGGLDQAEKAALIYKNSPGADPAVLAEIKTLDNQASGVIAPLMAKGNAITWSDAANASGVLAPFAAYLSQHGVQ